MDDKLIALVWFAFAAAVTPGPNNIMVTASAVNFGFRGTLNHMFGIAFGFGFMIVAVGLGLGQVFKALPQLHDVLRWVGTLYLIYLAWRVATAGRPQSADGGGRPLTFMQAALFQWVNPKAWMMSASALTAFTAQGGGLYARRLDGRLGVFSDDVSDPVHVVFVWHGNRAVASVRTDTDDIQLDDGDIDHCVDRDPFHLTVLCYSRWQ